MTEIDPNYFFLQCMHKLFLSEVSGVQPQKEKFCLSLWILACKYIVIEMSLQLKTERLIYMYICVCVCHLNWHFYLILCSNIRCWPILFRPVKVYWSALLPGVADLTNFTIHFIVFLAAYLYVYFYLNFSSSVGEVCFYKQIEQNQIFPIKEEECRPGL